LHAFTSPFTPATPFSLYAPFANRLLLYVRHRDSHSSGIPQDIFAAHCTRIMKVLTDIAQAAIRLEKQGRVTFEFRGLRHPLLPPDIKTHWRRFENIPPIQSEPILYLMSVDIKL
jgi:hypothetical protein